MFIPASGLADPWSTGGKQEAEPPPSYDDITGGAIADPWAIPTASVPQPQTSQPAPLADPWGGFPEATTTPSVSAAPAQQPQAVVE